MMDGGARRGVRAVKVRSLNLSGKSTQQRGGDGNHTGAGRRHQLINGHGRRATHHLGGRFLAFGDWVRQGGIPERTQRVIAAAQDFAFHRQGGVLAALSTCLTCDGNSALGGSGAVCGVQAASEDLVMSFQVAKRSAISVR